MNKRMKLTTFGLVPALLIAMAAPLTVQAGTLTIYNDNCTKTANFATKKRVKVDIDGREANKGCTDVTVTVHQGHSRVIHLETKGNDDGPCGKYRHEARGVAFGKFDVWGSDDSHVTCKRDWARVCQCTKD